jgi:PAS domain S-box-containing protein
VKTGQKSKILYSSTSGIFPLLAVALAGVAVCWVLYLWEANQQERTLRERETTRVEVLDYFFQGELRSAVSDLQMLADGDGLRGFVSGGDPTNLARAIHRAAFFSQQRPNYDQLRYLNEQGREIFRVNAGGAVAPEGQLQEKADRPYFQSVESMAVGETYVSPISLNLENGQIEKPFKPVVRFAARVADAAGRPRGAYVINYRVDDLLTHMQQVVPQQKGSRLRVLNADGYWLKASDPSMEWGFQLPERTGQTLAKSNPELWAEIAAGKSGQARTSDGLFTWRQFSPRDLAVGTNRVSAGDPFLVFASEVSGEDWAQVFVNVRRGALTALFGWGVLLVGGGWFWRGRQRAVIERDRFFTLTPDLLCIAGMDGFFRRLNPAWEKTLGYAEGELLSKPFIEFVHPDDREQTVKRYAELISGNDVISFENRYRCRDGSYRWLIWNARAIVREKLIIASARDTTEKKQAVEEQQRLHEEAKLRARQLEAANKELESFSYSVSHDLRAPLRHIDGFVELLAHKSSGSLDDAGRRYLGIISSSARQMGRLIDDLLSFSRMNRAELRRTMVPLDTMVKAAVEDLRMETGARKIVWKIGALPEVEADPAMLRQVWANLLGNAVKYTRTRETAEIEIAEIGDGGEEHVLCIRDNGVGFDMAYADKLFGVFQRLHSSDDFEGTGIGLANVRRIILRHGGRTWAEGTVGSGAAFYFTLPRRAQGADNRI